MISDTYLDWNTPQAEHTAEHVAAPQQLAPIVASYKSVSPGPVAGRGYAQSPRSAEPAEVAIIMLP